MGMRRNYYEIIDDLKRGVCTPALANRARAAIEELLQMHELDQSEIVRLRRLAEARGETREEREARYKRREFTPFEEEDLMTTLMLSQR